MAFAANVLKRWRSTKRCIYVSIFKRGLAGTNLKEELELYCRNTELPLYVMRAWRLQLQVDNVTLAETFAMRDLAESFATINHKWDFFPLRKENDTILSVDSFDFFANGYKQIAKYINNESLDPPIAAAFRALERFYAKKEEEERHLHWLHESEKTNETELACVLAKHLLSKLIPHESNYFLDERMKRRRPHICPCGCKRVMQFGVSRVGSPLLFYGDFDIVLFPTETEVFNAENGSSSVFTTRKDMKGLYLPHEDEFAIDEECENDAETTETKVENLGIFHNESTTRQICKQAISMSLCKLRNQTTGGKKNCTSFVPVTGISKNMYSLTLYDAENDYLLSSEESPIFEDDKSFRFSAIMDIWFAIYHSLFCTKPTDQNMLERINATCRLHATVGKEEFESAVRKSRMWFSKNVDKRNLYAASNVEKLSSQSRKSMLVEAFGKSSKPLLAELGAMGGAISNLSQEQESKR